MFVLRRMLYALVALLLLSIVIFLAVRVTGDPARVMAEPGASQEDLRALTRSLGLDRPLAVQYYVFVSKAVRGDFANSFQYKYPAIEVYLERLPASIQLGLAAFAISLLIGVPLGVMAALKVNTWWDSLGKSFGLLGLAVPGFWLGMVFILIFAVWLRILPSSGKGGIQNLLMPAIALGWYFAAANLRLIRSSMLEVLGSEHIRFSRLKGLPESLVVGKHALKNALLPVVTLSGINLVLMLNVAVVVETVFAWPGIGRLLYQSILVRDFPMVQTVTLLSGAMMVGVNLVVDCLYAWVDPRIRYAK